jgi:hypothetical protein
MLRVCESDAGACRQERPLWVAGEPPASAHMRARLCGLLFVLLCLLPALASAQTTETVIERCAVGGAHQDGCGLPATWCTYEDFLASRCPLVPLTEIPYLPGTSVAVPEVPDPIVLPDPVLVAPSALTDLGSAIRVQHDGVLTQWYTLKVDLVYQTHVTIDAWVDGIVLLPLLNPPAPGTHTVQVYACNDAACAKATLAIVR